MTTQSGWRPIVAFWLVLDISIRQLQRGQRPKRRRSDAKRTGEAEWCAACFFYMRRDYVKFFFCIRLDCLLYLSNVKCRLLGLHGSAPTYVDKLSSAVHIYQALENFPRSACAPVRLLP